MNGNKDAVICCIVLLEEPYLMEWITYHLKLGFSKIYIYDNSPNFDLQHFFDQTPDKIKDKIVLTHFPGSVQQIKAYEHFRINYSKKHTWVAIIDLDEFIVLKEWIPITQFLEKYCPTGSLSLNWRLFGSNNLISYSSEPVTCRFTKCEEKANRHVKTISRCQDIQNMWIHYVHLKPGFIQKDCHQHNLGGKSPFNYHPNTLDVAYINHYFTKSKDEWTIKRKRGRADTVDKRVDEEFILHDKNEVTDLSARNFYNDATLDFSV